MYLRGLLALLVPDAYVWSVGTALVPLYLDQGARTYQCWMVAIQNR